MGLQNRSGTYTRFQISILEKAYIILDYVEVQDPSVWSFGEIQLTIFEKYSKQRNPNISPRNPTKSPRNPKKIHRNPKHFTQKTKFVFRILSSSEFSFQNFCEICNCYSQMFLEFFGGNFVFQNIVKNLFSLRIFLKFFVSIFSRIFFRILFLSFYTSRSPAALSVPEMS